MSNYFIRTKRVLQGVRAETFSQSILFSYKLKVLSSNFSAVSSSLLSLVESKRKQFF